jgi:TPP-dependent 2-oxoacid decarboxylase
VRQAIEGSDCLICLAARFTDVATGFFSHRINPDAVIDIEPFTLSINGMFFNSVSAAELLSGHKCGAAHKCGDTIPISYIFFVRNPGPIRN